MLRCDIVAPSGQHFELLEVRCCVCAGLDGPFLVAVSSNATLYLSLWLFLLEGWRFSQRREHPRTDVAKRLEAA